MAILVVGRYYIIINLLFALTLLNLIHCFSPKKLNTSAVATGDSDWSTAGATLYGNATGYGTDGGACGYGKAVADPPFSSMVSAGGPSLYKSGKGCGACYQVKCTSKSECSTNPVTVIITDECQGCVTEPFHFDLSGSAFGAMAIPGQENQLRGAGVLQILFRKVACNSGEKMTFQMDKGSNPNYFSALVKYVDGDGEIGQVELKQALDSDTWLPLSQSSSAVWKLGPVSSPFRAPLSLRLTSLNSGETVVASDVIPANWQPGATYKSNVNFQV